MWGRSRRRHAGAALLALLALPAGMARGGELPPEGACPAAPVALREGAQLAYADVLRLREWLPVEVWRLREVFFHQGMRLELGPCHRRYPEPAFWREATRHFAGSAQLDADGNLRGYTAGLPFPPASIHAQAPDAAARWAWNLEQRYRGAGPRGNFRIVDLPGERGGVQTYSGEFFQLQLAARADLAASDYRAEPADTAWIAGGRFQTPQGVRHLAWRQTRSPEARRRYASSDEIFVYVPSLRKLRRAPSAWVDGLFVPRYRLGGGATGGSFAVSSGGGARGAPAAPSAGGSIAATEHLARGFTGLSIRPNAYVWRWLGERDVLAPLNAVRAGYPAEPARRFGPSGLSAGSDRWELRRAVRIEGALREGGRDYDRVAIWIDAQTAQPLYWIARRRDGALVEVGVLLHRFSGDRPGYPAFPDGTPAQVFDPVAALFYQSADGGSGWRRESYDLRSTPPDAETLRRYTHPSFLERGR